MSSLTKKTLTQLIALKREQVQAIELHNCREFTASNKSEYKSTLQRLQKRLEEIETAITTHK